MTFKDISVESPKTDVEPHSLGSRSPKCFMFMETNISTVRKDWSCNYVSIWLIYLFTFHTVVLWNDIAVGESTTV